MLLDHEVSVDITGIDGRIPVRAAACNVLLEVTRQLLSNGCNVHVAMKRDLRALLAAADCGNVEGFCKFPKHSDHVVFAIEKYSELLTAAAVKDHIDDSRELLKTCHLMIVSKKHGWAPFIIAARTGIWRYCGCCCIMSPSKVVTLH